MWERRGTVEVKTSNAEVTGIGTDFISVPRVGDAFIGPDNRMYEIMEIQSETSLTISPMYRGSNATGSYCIIPVRYYHPEIVDKVFEIIDVLESIGQLPPWMLEFDKSQAVEAISDTVAGTDRIPRGYMGKDWIPDGMVYKDNGKIPNNLIPSRVVRDPITADMLEESFLTQLKQEFTGQRG